MRFQPAVSLTEQIAEHLGQRIITGRLKPGDRIQELKVAGELGVSRGSVREALLILESRHLIEIVPRRGAVVSPLEAGAIVDFGELYADLVVSCFRRLTALDRRQLARCGGLDGLRAGLGQIADAVASEDHAGLIDGRRNFLEAGLQALDHHYLAAVLRGLIPVGLRLTHLAAAHPNFDPRDTLRAHQALLEAVENQDPARVGELVCAFSRREGKLAAESLALQRSEDLSYALCGNGRLAPQPVS